jgi:hypothetical protein
MTKHSNLLNTEARISRPNYLRNSAINITKTLQDMVISQVNLRNKLRNNFDHATNNNETASDFEDGISFLKSEQVKMVAKHNRD